MQVGPTWVGLENYKTIFSDVSLLKYTANTLIMWVIGFIPQIIVSLLLGQWFSDVRLKLKGSRFFKTVIYLPNLIMASAFSMLFLHCSQMSDQSMPFLSRWELPLRKIR